MHHRADLLAFPYAAARASPPMRALHHLGASLALGTMTRSEMRQSEHFRFARLKRACPGPRSTRSVLVEAVA